jgi:hypothetical protein
MLTREDLEDILNNKPHGYAKQFMKKKGFTKSSYIAMPYKIQKLDPITITVFSSDKEAFDAAKRQFYSTHSKHIEYDGVEWKRKV